MRPKLTFTVVNFLINGQKCYACRDPNNEQNQHQQQKKQTTPFIHFLFMPFEPTMTAPTHPPPLPRTSSTSSTTTSTASSACQVRVGVRIRPLTSNEHKQGGKQILNVSPSSSLSSQTSSISIGERKFTYDAVFDANISQQELYESVSKPLLGSFIDGYNATVRSQQHNIVRFYTLDDL